MLKILISVLSFTSFTASAYIVNQISEDQKLDISENLHTTDKDLQAALAKNIQGSDLQITSFNSPGTFSTGKISFQFKDADPKKIVTFDCNLYVLHEADISVTNCSGYESGGGSAKKSVSLSTFNKVSANNPAQNAIVMKGLYHADPSNLPTPRDAPSEGDPGAGK